MRMWKKGVFLIFPFLLVFLISLYSRKLFHELPQPEVVKSYTPALSSRVYDVNKELITEFYIEKRTWVTLSEISKYFKKAVLAIEDHRFYKHYGISYRGIVRAVLHNFLKRRLIAGGSTITQQLAKLAFLTPERTVSRKIKELLLALQIESNFSKDEILEMYLNQAYFGHGTYGISQAAQYYFSKSPSELNIAESALLAGLIRYPKFCSPFVDPKRAFWRRKTVLSRMRKLGYITKEQESLANLEPLPGAKPIRTSHTHIGPYFIESVRLELEEKVGSEMLYTGGLNIYTTLDKRMQEIAQEVFSHHLNKFDERQYTLRKSTEKVQGALLAMDVKTGKILAMIGGRNFKESQFNRAIQAYRQPGSAFKVFVMLTALMHGYTPASILEDAPLIYMNDGRDWRLKSRSTDYLLTLDSKTLNDPMKVWVPQNYRDRYYGNVTLRRALELSLNSCAVKLTEELGTARVIDTARRIGITSPLINTYSLALGASEVTLIELLSAYNVFANKGVYVKPYMVERVYDGYGRLIFEHKIAEKEVLPPEYAFLMTNILKGVLERGTARWCAKKLGIPAAGKTGTSDDCADAWFIGYTPDLICGVWVGYDEKVSLGKRNTGGVVAAPIWVEFTKKAVDRKTDFKVPENIRFVYINPKDGLLAQDTSKGFCEAFISGTEPFQFSPSVEVTSAEITEEETGF